MEELKELIIEAGKAHREEMYWRGVGERARQKIAKLMPPIPEGQDKVEVKAGEFIAKMSYNYQTTVLPKKLYELDERLFWDLVSIPSSRAKEALGKEIFHRVSETKREDQARLSIREDKCGKRV